MANLIKCIECGTDITVGESLDAGDSIDCPECLVKMTLKREGDKIELNYAKGYKRAKEDTNYSDQDFGSYD